MRRACLGLIALLAVAGCKRDGGVIGQAELHDISGKFVFEDDYRTVALTAVQHSIYYISGESRTLIFEGEGGTRPTLSLLSPDDVLVSYCGGRILKVSSFFERQSDESGDLRLIRIQPVTSKGLSANGTTIC